MTVVYQAAGDAFWAVSGRAKAATVTGSSLPWFYGPVVVVAVGLVAVAVGVLDEPFVAGVGVAEGVSVTGEVDC